MSQPKPARKTRKKRRRSRRPSPGRGYPPRLALSREMQGYIDQLGKICEPSQIKEKPAGFAGVFLEPVPLEFIPRYGPGSEIYQNTTLEYSGFVERTKAFIATRQIFCRALATNPTTRALSLLAVGKGAVKMLERGVAPSGLFNKFQPVDYNRHHIVQKSARPLDRRPINHLSNLVLIHSGATGEWRSNPKHPSYQPTLDPHSPHYRPEVAQRPDLNAHHFFHGALLVSQTEPGTGTQPRSMVYCPRPAFPVFPPISRTLGALHSREEVYRALEVMEPGITQGLPQSFQKWADKLVAFSSANQHRPYRVPSAYHSATRGYTQIYEEEDRKKHSWSPLSIHPRPSLQANREKSQDRRRRDMARAQAETAASFLPLDAKVNGQSVAEILRRASRQGRPIEHHPVPLVPKGWKPLPSYQARFPSIEKVHQNMRAVGLGARIPRARGETPAIHRRPATSLSFLGQKLSFPPLLSGRSKQLSWTPEKPNPQHQTP